MHNAFDRLLVLHVAEDCPEFIPTAFNGTEAISQCYTFDITAWSTLAPKDAPGLIGQPIALGIYQVHSETYLWFQGIVDKISVNEPAWRDYRCYHLTLIPQLGLSDLSVDCRTYLDSDVITVIEHIFTQNLNGHYTLGTVHDYPKQPLWVQFNETTFAFTQRVLANWGIYYTFTMDQHQHTCVLADTCPTAKAPFLLKQGDTLTQWHTRRRANPITHTIICNSADAEITINHDHHYNPKPPDTVRLHYPATRYLAHPKETDEYAAQQRTAYAQNDTHHSGQTHYPGLRPGQRATIQTKQGSQDILITHITHHATCPHPIIPNTTLPEYAHLPQYTHLPQQTQYTADFQAINTPEHYYPPQPPPRPLEHGIHFGWVTDNISENTIEPHGQVRVHFIWDHHRPVEESSTHWLRIRYPGPTLQTSVLPQIGELVALMFDNGRVEHPVVVGSLYHPHTAEPIHKLPHNATQSGINTTTHQGLTFDDTPHNEHVTLRAARNYQAHIGDTLTTTIGGHHTCSIGGQLNYTLTEGSQTVNLNGNDTTTLTQGQFHLSAQHGVTFTTPGATLALTPEGIRLNAQRIQLLSEHGGSPQRVAYLGTPHALANEAGCLMGTIQTGASNVRVNGKPVARQGDAGEFNTTIAEGVPGIYVDGQCIAGVTSPLSGNSINGVVTDSHANVTTQGYQPQPAHRESDTLRYAVKHLVPEQQRPVIPIIFVPGIMGSRIRYADGTPINKKNKVWDPDALWQTYTRYRKMTPQQRKDFAFKHGIEGLEVILDDAKHNDRFADYFLLDTAPDTPENAKRLAEIERLDQQIRRIQGGRTAAERWYLLQQKRDALDRAARVDTDELIRRGWGGVYWYSYGNLLTALTQDTALGELGLNLFVDCPVHAFGYNWLQSNADSGEALAQYINDTLTHYQNQGRDCNNVCLITHSMGGLVARAACAFHADIEDKVLGVIHVGQPACGAPVAYSRMKQGLETPSGFTPLADAAARVIGNSGEHITAVMAASPAGLELLPNKHYRTHDGEMGWLRIYTEPGRKDRFYTLPKHDPYQEIYREPKQLERLIEPEWLLLEEKDESLPTERDDNATPTWAVYERALSKAELFHDALDNKHHKQTVEIYTTDYATPDYLYYDSRDITQEYIIPWVNRASKAQGPYNHSAYWKLLSRTVHEWFPKQSKEQFSATIDYTGGEAPLNYTIKDALEVGVDRYTLHLPQDAYHGDGTVPVHSASYLSTVTNSTAIAYAFGERELPKKEREHQNLLNSRPIQQKIKACLVQWIKAELIQEQPQTEETDALV